MITVPGLRCQTLCALIIGSVWTLSCSRVFAAAEAPPPVPAWQQDIVAARLLEGSLALAPAKDPAEREARHSRLQTLYRDLAGKYPTEAAVQTAAGDFFLRDGQPTVALPFWEKAVRLNPHNADTADRLGGLYVKLGRTRDAYGQFRHAVDASPEVASYRFDLANVIYLFRNDLVSPPIPGLPDEQAALREALAQFRRAAELAPTDLRLAQAYAETFYVFPKPDWAQALTAWEGVLALSGDQSDFPNSHLARVSLRLGKPDAAAQYLARMHDPAFVDLKAKLLQQTERQRATDRPR